MKVLKIIRRSAFWLTILVTPFAAKADVVYEFDATEVGDFGTGPYGTVRLHANGTGGIEFTVGLRSDLNFVNTGNDLKKGVFTFNATGVLPSDVSAVLFNGSAVTGYAVYEDVGNPPFTTGNTTFTLGIDCLTCANGAPGQVVDPLTFTVADSAYGDFGFTTASTTAFFASDVICFTGDCNGKTGAIGVTKEGDDEGTPPSEIPEPGILALTGLGLLGVAFARRNRRS